MVHDFPAHCCQCCLLQICRRWACVVMQEESLPAHHCEETYCNITHCNSPDSLRRCECSHRLQLLAECEHVRGFFTAFRRLTVPVTESLPHTVHVTFEEFCCFRYLSHQELYDKALFYTRSGKVWRHLVLPLMRRSGALRYLSVLPPTVHRGILLFSCSRLKEKN